MPDIFVGCDEGECKARMRQNFLFLLQGARKRVRLARRRLDGSSLTSTEIKVLKLLLAETSDILTTSPDLP